MFNQRQDRPQKQAGQAYAVGRIKHEAKLMAPQKNIPDRTKLILQFIVFSLGAWLPFIFIILLLCMFLNINVEGSNMVLLIWGLLVVSILIQGAIFIHRWKKLLAQERSGEFPDMQDMRNITPRQMIFLAIGAPLFAISFVLFQFDYKPAAALCLITLLLLVAIERAYVKRRYKRIKEGNSIE